MTSRGTPEFWQLYWNLPPDIRLAAQGAYRKFAADPAHPGLRLERLRADPRAWSVRVTRNYRAAALRHGDNWLWFFIGSHQEFDRRFPH